MTRLSTYDFSTLHTTLSHNEVKESEPSKKSNTFLACNNKKVYFTSTDHTCRCCKLWFCQNVLRTFSYHFENIYIIFASKLYQQIVGIPMGAKCTSHVADLFLFCYERDLMTSS